MRPKAITTFEALFAGSMLLSLLNIFVIAPGEGRLFEAALAVVTLGLALAVSRMRSNAVRWILTVLVLLGAAGQAYVLATDGLAASGGALGLLITALQLGAIAQLFRAEASAWLTNKESSAAA
ncbi:MAG TPA: hypothetical protein VEZ48_01855 [Sphingomonadaceae bacterium]|nr:hypothetical protein [Sphingomonadaceae bacterium]